jgi:MFS family permease
MSLVGILGNTLTLFYSNYNMLFAGKLIAGLSAGGISCFCPKYIMEVSPPEVSGSTGALFMLFVTVGIWLNAIVSLPYGSEPDFDMAVQNYYLLSGLPILFALIILVFLTLVFNDDTPASMVERNCDEAKVYRFMNRLYNDYRLMEDRIKDIYKKIDEAGGESAPKVGCCQSFSSKEYRYASWLGIFMSASQRLTGINMVLYYSSTIFRNSDLPAIWVNFLVYAVNCIGCLFSVFLLGYFGRKQIMMALVPLQAVMMILLSLFLGWFNYLGFADTGAIVACLVFVAFF